MKNTFTLPKSFSACFEKRSELSAEREGRYLRLCGMTRDWLLNESRDIQKGAMLRGYDRSEEDWKKITMKYELSKKGVPPLDKIRKSARSRAAAERRAGRPLVIAAAEKMAAAAG